MLSKESLLKFIGTIFPGLLTSTEKETHKMVIKISETYKRGIKKIMEDMNLLPCFLSSFFEGGGDVEDSDFPLLISCLFDKSLSFSKFLSSFLLDSTILCIAEKRVNIYIKK